MKNSRQKGFMVPLLIIIIAVLVIGGGIYIYQKNKGSSKNSLAITQNSNSASDNTTSTTTSNWQSGDQFVSFDKIRTYLESKNPSVPILLPTSFPSNFKVGTSQGNLYIFANITSTGYRIDMSYGIECGNTNACFAGYFEANNENALITDGSEKVNLINNIVGYYLPQSCGASCSPQSIQWMYKNVLYTIQLGGEKTELVNIANSAIQNVTSVMTSNKSDTNNSTATNLMSSQIFQEASLQLGFTRSQLNYFRIFGQDKIQYSFGPGTNFAYKTGGKWYLVGKGNYEDVAECSDYVSVPSQYNPGCYNQTTGKSEYININPDGTGTSVNYPPSQMISYIGE